MEAPLEAVEHIARTADISSSEGILVPYNPAADIAAVSREAAKLARQTSLAVRSKQQSHRLSTKPNAADLGILPVRRPLRSIDQSDLMPRRQTGARQLCKVLQPWPGQSYTYKWTSPRSSLRTCFMTLRDFDVCPRHVGGMEFNLPIPLDEIEIFSILELANRADQGDFDAANRQQRQNIDEVEWCTSVLRHLHKRFDNEVHRRRHSAVDESDVEVRNVKKWSVEAAEYLGLLIEDEGDHFTVPSSLYAVEKDNINTLRAIYKGESIPIQSLVTILTKSRRQEQSSLRECDHRSRQL